MRCVVQKYGGSSVSDLDKLRLVAERIARTRAEGVGVVAVVSAMGTTTNELIALARQVARTPDRRELDMLVSVGERISVALLAMALREIGVPARSLTGSQSGIITDEAHAGARVLAVRPERLVACLEAGEVAVVAGFQGVSREREVTTLGRGGSDTTAVVLAAALGAEYCEICSDVDGVWSADPRVVPEARRLDHLSLEGALALARGGAKVLFEDAVRYARDHGVELQASTTFGPGAGTRLTVAAPDESARAVTGDDQLRRLRVRSGEAVGALERQGGRVRRRVGPVLYLDMRNVHGDLVLPEGALDEGPTAVITATASGLGEQAALGLGLERALAEGGVSVLAGGGEADTLWWEVGRSEVDRAVRVVHAALCAPAA
jgi:aspartate kinase